LQASISGSIGFYFINFIFDFLELNFKLIEALQLYHFASINDCINYSGFLGNLGLRLG
jgi:hypothetical protein